MAAASPAEDRVGEQDSQPAFEMLELVGGDPAVRAPRQMLLDSPLGLGALVRTWRGPRLGGVALSRGPAGERGLSLPAWPEGSGGSAAGQSFPVSRQIWFFLVVSVLPVSHVHWWTRAPGAVEMSLTSTHLPLWTATSW